MPSILITQCVQNDFVRTLAPGESLPNLVHVGQLEAERLCGPQGALLQFLQAAHAVDPPKLAIIHVVDRHDSTAHAAHLALFRAHCLQNTDGARIIDPIEELAQRRPNTFVVEAGDLNDFEDSKLAQVLGDLTGGRPDAQTAIGVVGVWTDVKVSFLLYDLRTRLRAARLATCSALTASRSIEAHFRALESLKAILDIDVLHSSGSFLDWLAPGQQPTATRPRGATLVFKREPQTPAAWNADSVRERDALIGRLADAENLELSPLGGGFSGAQVFIGRAANMPARIFKVGARDEVALERFGNERVRRVLGDVVPRLLAWQEGTKLGAMKLELAESGDPLAAGPVTFKQLYESDSAPAATEALQSALETALDAALGRFYRTAEKDNADLLELYGFTDRFSRPRFGDLVAAKATEIALASGFDSTRELLKNAGLPDDWLEPAEFYEKWLPGRVLTREILPALCHGDLNLANILLARRAGEERPARVWLIDFARLVRLPNLTDFAKIENDLSFILLPVQDAPALARAQELQELRLASPGLELPGIEAATRTPDEKRYAQLLAALRRSAARMDPRGAPAMGDYRVALLRYAAHTLGFDEPNLLQRRLALLACARLSGLLAREARGTERGIR